MRDLKPIKGELLAEIQQLQPIECGREAAKHFAFDNDYINLNHGSYGTYPVEIRNVFQKLQNLTEARPDEFVRYRYRTGLLDESRETIAQYLKVPSSSCVLSPNATLAFDTVVYNFQFQPGDVAIYFDSVYGSFENTLIWLSETSPLELSRIEYENPIADRDLCRLFEERIASIQSQGKRPVLALFDTISSTPGLRMPFENLTKICKDHKIYSIIDAAHGVGHVPLDLSTLDPDFLTSNCHKWLHVPRGCAVLYVPPRNQHLLRATLPTGFGFTPRTAGPSDFVANFASLGTLDDNPYLCLEAAILWRQRLTWKELRGEDAIMGYIAHLAREGGKLVADMLGTEILDNAEKSLMKDVGMVNIRLPLDARAILDRDDAKRAMVVVRDWIMRCCIVEYGIAVMGMDYGEHWFIRLSAQVYVDMDDFAKAGKMLKEVCERVRRGEWRE